MTTEKMAALHWAVLVLTATMFGSSFFFIKTTVDFIPAATLAAGRAALAVPVAWAFLKLTGGRFPPLGPDWIPLTVLGILTAALPYGAIAWGQRHIDSSIAGMLFGMVPVFSVVLAPLFLRDEALTAGRLSGAALSYALGGIYARRHRRIAPAVMAAGQLLTAALILLPLALVLDAPWTLSPPTSALGAVAAVAVLSTALPSLLLFWLIGRVGATNGALLAFFMPVVAVVLGVALLGEHLPWTAHRSRPDFDRPRCGQRPPAVAGEGNCLTPPSPTRRHDMKTHHRLTGIAVALLAVFSLAQPAAAQQAIAGFVPPAGWLPPPPHPAGVELETKELSPGVFALLSPRPPVDNAGFVVGEDGVLVIDAHFGAAMAGQVQAAIRKITDKPILYLVNTNAHGDHTFGNHAFPATTKVVAHRKTAESMARFEDEKALLLPTVNGDVAFLDDVRLRLPDVVFEDSLCLDLGGRVVELHHFGHGNTPGDTVVYVPAAKIAWTGNLVLGADTIPWAIEGGTRDYLQTIARFAASLDVETIIGGHGPITSAAILGTYLHYLGTHIDAVQGAIRAGLTLDETLAALPLAESFLPPADSPMAPARPLMQGFHLWNVKKTYTELNGT